MLASVTRIEDGWALLRWKGSALEAWVPVAFLPARTTTNTLLRARALRGAGYGLRLAREFTAEQAPAGSRARRARVRAAREAA